MSERTKIFIIFSSIGIWSILIHIGGMPVPMKKETLAYFASKIFKMQNPVIIDTDNKLYGTKAYICERNEDLFRSNNSDSILQGENIYNVGRFIFENNEFDTLLVGEHYSILQFKEQRNPIFLEFSFIPTITQPDENCDLNWSDSRSEEYTTGIYQCLLEESFPLWFYYSDGAIITAYQWLRRLFAPRIKNLPDIPDIIEAGYYLTYDSTLAYIPFPLENGDMYVFSESLFLNDFLFDTEFCGKRNYYAVKYQMAHSLELYTTVLMSDENGVLVRLNAEKPPKNYRVFIKKMEKHTDRFTAFLKDSGRPNFKANTDCEQVQKWDEVKKASSQVDTVYQDYDSLVFVNAYHLITNYIKTKNIEQNNLELIQFLHTEAYMEDF